MLRNNALTINNITLSDYNNLFLGAVNLNLINDIYDLGLLIDDQLNINDRTVRQILSHHIIDTACEYIVEHDSNTVFTYNCEELIQTEFFYYCDNDKAIDVLIRLFNNIRSMTGIIFAERPGKFSELQNKFTNRDGETIDLINSYLNKHKPFNLHRLHTYITKHGLTDLQKKFFENYKYKLVLA